MLKALEKSMIKTFVFLWLSKDIARESAVESN